MESSWRFLWERTPDWLVGLLRAFHAENLSIAGEDGQEKEEAFEKSLEKMPQFFCPFHYFEPVVFRRKGIDCSSIVERAWVVAFHSLKILPAAEAFTSPTTTTTTACCANWTLCFPLVPFGERQRPTALQWVRLSSSSAPTSTQFL